MLCTKETVKELGLNLWVDGGVNEEGAQIDIILVQGLGAHPYYTWTGRPERSKGIHRESHSTIWKKRLPFRTSLRQDSTQPAQDSIGWHEAEFFWPRDLLGPALPPARIFTYAYKTDWKQRNGKDEIRKQGEQLMNVVYNYQQQQHTKTPERPLLFIGHSLGGLVIQQALVLANHINDFRSLKNSVCGMIFLGSPMQGCELAKFARGIQWTVCNDSPLLRSLCTGSSDLQALLRDFWNSYHHLDIVCCIEDEVSKYGIIKTQTVSPQSAAPLGGRTLYFAANHSNLNKFKNHDDANYQLFLPVVRNMCQAALSQQSNVSLSVPSKEQTHQANSCSAAPTEESTHQDSLKHSEEAQQLIPTTTDAAVITKSHWIVPFERNPRFTGRQKELEELQNKLLAETVDYTEKIAIVGLGGIGKTQIILEALYQIKRMNRGYTIIWIATNSVQSLEQGYLDAVKQLEIPGHEDHDRDAKSLLQEYLSGNAAGKWLLVYDNIDDIDMWTSRIAPHQNESHLVQKNIGGTSSLRDYLPRNPRGKILFTTRDRKAADSLAQANVINLYGMDADTSAALFRKNLSSPERVSNLNHEDVDSLIAALEYLPLAIVQAAAYLRCNSLTVSQYLSLIAENEEDAIDVLSEDFVDDTRYQDVSHAVAKTWLTSFKQMQIRDPQAASYLAFIACIDSKNIPISLLPPARSKAVTTRAIGTLSAYAFVSQQTGGQMLDIHRLVHLAARNWLRREGVLDEWNQDTLDYIAKVFPTSDHENRKIWRMFLPHALLILARKEDTISTEKLTLMGTCGSCLYADGRWSDADALFEQLSLHRDQLSKAHSVQVDKWIANIRQKQGRHEEAGRVYLRMVEVSRSVLGSDHPDTLLAMQNLAVVYQSQRRYEEAEQLQLEVIRILKATRGSNDSRLLLVMHHLSTTYLFQARYKEAEELQVEVISMQKETLGSEHLDTLSTMNNLSTTYYTQHRYEEAERLQVQVLEARRSMLGNDHPDTLYTMSLLAGTCSATYRVGKAIELLEEFLKHALPVMGAQHPHVTAAIDHLQACKAVGS